MYVVTFLKNFAEANAILLPARIPGYKRDDVQLLPPSTTIKVLHSTHTYLYPILSLSAHTGCLGAVQAVLSGSWTPGCGLYLLQFTVEAADPSNHGDEAHE